jgi:hypothetical protein
VPSEAITKPHVHWKFEIFWTNIASTMACPNFKNGPKNGLGPLGIKKWLFWPSKLSCPLKAQGKKLFFQLWMLTLLPLKVLMSWELGFFTYSSIKEHFTSIVGLERNRSYNYQSLQLRNNGFSVWGGLATANPSKISLSHFWTMSTFHMARALLIEIVLYVTIMAYIPSIP